nr:MASE1 domain-containing protein [Bordetella genomosp. 13]
MINQGKWAFLTATLFLTSLAINEWVFTNLEFVRGINWIYLPAGVRLVCTLLFGAAGAVGLLAASWAACFFYFFPDDFVRALMGGIIAAVAPYLAYRWARAALGLRRDLGNLTAGRLVICAVAYALVNAVAHHLWFYFHGARAGLLDSLAVMFIGDLTGSLIMLYALKALLAVLRRSRHHAWA